MPIISTVGRKQKKLRILIASLYFVLAVGATTMVYPFLLMVATSFTSPVDQNEFKIVPRYLYDDARLYQKYIESKYSENPVLYNIRHGTEYAKFDELPPKTVNRSFVREWRRFKSQLPLDRMMVAHSYTISMITPEMSRRFREYVRYKYKGDLDRFNRECRETCENWMEVGIPLEDWTLRNFVPLRKPKYLLFLEFKKTIPERYLITVATDGLYQEYLRQRFGSITAINNALRSNYKSRSDIRLSARVPKGYEAHIWETYVRKEFPIFFIKLDPDAAKRYVSFLQSKYVTAGAYNHAYQTNVRSFAEVEFPRTAPDSGVMLADWLEFLESAVPIEMLELRTPEILFREYLVKRFGNLQGINSSLGTRFASLEQIEPPYMQNDWLELLENRKQIRREFIVRNYREVVQYIALHGRSLLNTGILCAAMVLTALTVNPLCAYALSRFNLRSTYKILLFLLATMAFPAEVSAIPSFLLVKQLHLLGTYWAVILPSMANGYSIFLLKGFFDSLPRELYEAATIDGATEMQMYWRITLQLCKPVLAVIALGTFTAAYGSFMWAFLVLQDPKMWTLMVWLFQLQAWAPQFLVYAGLVLAAIPTLLVFIFCQNVIMRGVIIPTEK
ncbi:MAG: carbohydrate ABC transporter permease [Armatimonadota bacterium]